MANRQKNPKGDAKKAKYLLQLDRRKAYFVAVCRYVFFLLFLSASMKEVKLGAKFPLSNH